MRTIALLTDFGTRDPYVAAMKGVIASRTDVPVADLTHDIAPFAIFDAAWFLRAAVPYWPAGTVFVVIVDPGVGSARRILAATQGERTFVAPDNGVLTFVLDSDAEVVSVEDARWFLPGGSNTFHGRDRFAPVAAAIANGTRVADLGPRVEGIVRLDYTPPSYGEITTGTIVGVDRFGNLITDVERSRIPLEAIELRAGGHLVVRSAHSYAEAAPDMPFLIVGSTGCIEISVRNGSAAERLQLSRLVRVEVCRRAASS